jgi:myo-inositol-1-phosphate synthase
MTKRRIGLWLIGACGGVGTTVALGLAALARGVRDTTGLVTALPLFDGLNLDAPADFFVGGHDIRRTSFLTTVTEFQERSNIFPTALVEPCRATLEAWNGNIRPGTVLQAGETIAGMADLPGCHATGTPGQAVERIQHDLQQFQQKERLDQLVVLNVASTEPPFPVGDLHQSHGKLWAALQEGQQVPLPASSLYAIAAIDLGLPYVNFTPSLGASFPAALELAQQRRTVVAGQDGKTGETLLKSVLAPMFALRNLQLLSWVGHNIFGNRDGLVLNDPRNKESKIRTKDQLIQQIVGYPPQTHVSIEYIPSLDDWKTAWDHIHFQGFLGVKMIMQFIWQGCDSILAAPLAIDLVRLALFAQRQGEMGVLRHLACFFKNPMGVQEHDFFVQWRMLEDYVRSHQVK